MTGRRDERGVALALVVWVLVVLGFITTGIVAQSRRESAVVIGLRARSVARYAAESGVVATSVRLRRLLRSAGSPEEQARLIMELDRRMALRREQAVGGGGGGGGGRFQVAVTDLGARLDLNHADEASLLGLFQQFAGERQARALVDALEDWKDADDEPRPLGAEREEYRRAGSPFVPANRPLYRLDELTRIRGFDDAVTVLIAPYITVKGDERVNVNTAPAPVLAAMPGLGQAGADFILTGRRRGEVLASLFETRDHLREMAGAGVRVDLPRLRSMPGRLLIVSRGWQEGHPLTHEIQAVVELEGLRLEDGPRLRLVHWTERDL